jgi:pyrroloquinoline quinone (PQQ) biosynthesis protein C
MELFELLDGARERWDVLKHPFYARWERGELSQEELAFYAGEYRHAVTALAHTAGAGGSEEHAAEERAHIDLWDDFAAALDAPLDREPTPETIACAESWSTDDPLEAAAIMYAVESAQPAISATKLSGLVEHYGFEADSPGAAYFALHAERDHEHAAEAREHLEAGAKREDTDRLVSAAEAALKGNWRLLDGVEGASSRG